MFKVIQRALCKPLFSGCNKFMFLAFLFLYAYFADAKKIQNGKLRKRFRILAIQGVPSSLSIVIICKKLGIDVLNVFSHHLTNFLGIVFGF